MSYRVLLLEERMPGEDGTHWLALHPDLLGCHALERTQDEALAALDDARDTWLRVARKHGGKIPVESEQPMVTVQYLLDPASAQGIADKAPVPLVTIQPA